MSHWRCCHQPNQPAAVQLIAALTMAVLICIGASPRALAQTCTAADFAAAIDRSGSAIHGFSSQTQPELSARMQRYAETQGLTGADVQEVVFERIYDATLEALDKRTSELLMRIDQLGRVAEGDEPDCSKLDEIDNASAELLDVMRDKSRHMLAKLDAGIAAAKPEAAGAETPPAANPERAAAPPRPAPAPDRKPQGDAAVATQPWSAETKPSDAYVPPPRVAEAPLPEYAAPAAEEGYTIDEVREISRGFFGTLSTNLASVIEHAFRTSGRPTAYVLGTEGGGAFLAGLRYGKGKLYMRRQDEVRDVYWHGPSLGTDFGASGSRTMFLIYRLDGYDALFRTFTGLDGSAYFVGGVGVTLLKGGDVIMAPIRTGLGFRVGANIGYLRFTPRPTWNPF